MLGAVTRPAQPRSGTVSRPTSGCTIPRAIVSAASRSSKPGRSQMSSVWSMVASKENSGAGAPGRKVQGRYRAISGRVVKRLEGEMPCSFGRIGKFADIAPSLLVVRDDELVHTGRHDVALH